MASSNPDIEAQINSAAAIANLPPTTNTAIPQLPTTGPWPQATNTDKHHLGYPPAKQTADNSEVRRVPDENQGDPSDGLWSMYLTEAEKQDTEVTESWKGDTDGILVFTGLFSATIAAFIVESYKKLSPDSGDTTNALLVQISQQLVNISHGAPLASITEQSKQSFKPPASAVRVNVLWFLSLVLSLSCALSATLMQQWARRYRELAQRRGAFHRRGRMRAYIFDGINRFGMSRAVATMPTLLHISVFLFFTGLVEFLFPIYTPVAYTTLGCIVVFALTYAILTVLPNIYLNCPYATPLSGFTWRISQLSAFVFLWTILKIDGLIRKPFSKLWSLVNQHVPERHGPKMWREKLDKQVKIHQQQLSQSLRKSVELSAYSAHSTVVTSALEWTLTALDEDKEIEDFAARVPGFFDSRVVPDATSAVLSLISHQPNTDPVLGSRLYDLLKTCVPGTPLLDDKMRKHRLRVCLNCLWYFGRVYNHPEVSQPLPSYFPNSLIPEITRRVQTEEDSTLRLIGRCVLAVVINKLAADPKSRTILVDDGVLTCLSPFLGTESYDLELLRHQPGTVALANTISLAFGEVGTLAADAVPPDVLDVVQQTLAILSRALLAQEKAELQPGQSMSETDGPDGKFGPIPVLRLLRFLNTCMRTPSRLTDEVCTNCLRMCLKRLLFIGFNRRGELGLLLFDLRIVFSDPEMIRFVCEHQDSAVRAIGRCFWALVINNLAAELNSCIDTIRDVELECLSVILGTGSDEVLLLLSYPGAIQFANMVFFALANIDTASARVPSAVLDMVQETFGILSQDLPHQLKTWLDNTGTLMNVSDGMYKRILYICLKNLWSVVRAFNERGNSVPLPFYICRAFTTSVMTRRRIHQDADPAINLIGHCVGALLVNKVVSDLKSRTVPASKEEVDCLSNILGTQSQHVTVWLRHPGATELAGVVSLIFDVVRSLATNVMPSDVLDVVQQTLDLISRTLPEKRIAQPQRDQTTLPISDSNVDFARIISSHLEEFLEACISNTSPLTMEVRTNCLRIFLKSLWYFARSYHQLDAPMPSYFPFVHASPEITHLIQTELDPTARVIGRCFEALVVDKLAEGSNSLSDEGVACISAILGTERHIVWHWLTQPGAIDLRNVISVIADEINTFVADELPADVLEILQHTLSIIARNIARGRGSADEDLYMEQVLYFHSIFSTVADARGPEWLKYRLEWILSQLPAVEDRNRWQRGGLISDEQLSEYSDNSLRSSSDSTS